MPSYIQVLIKNARCQSYGAKVNVPDTITLNWKSLCRFHPIEYFREFFLHRNCFECVALTLTRITTKLIQIANIHKKIIIEEHLPTGIVHVIWIYALDWIEVICKCFYALVGSYLHIFVAIHDTGKALNIIMLNKQPSQSNYQTIKIVSTPRFCYPSVCYVSILSSLAFRLILSSGFSWLYHILFDIA